MYSRMTHALWFLHIKVSTLDLSPENNDVIISKHISDDAMWNSTTEFSG